MISIYLNYLFDKLGNSVKLYLGAWNNIPAATCMIIEHNDIINLHHITTLPNFRNKGLAKSLILLSLIKAKEKFIKTAILGTSPMGQSLYEKIGFKTYSSFESYVLESQI